MYQGKFKDNTQSHKAAHGDHFQLTFSMPASHHCSLWKGSSRMEASGGEAETQHLTVSPVLPKERLAAASVCVH